MNELFHDRRLQLAVATTVLTGSIALAVYTRSDRHPLITSGLTKPAPQQDTYRTLLDQVNGTVQSDTDLKTKLNIVTAAACTIDSNIRSVASAPKPAIDAHNQLEQTYEKLVESSNGNLTVSVRSSLQNAQQESCPAKMHIYHNESVVSSDGSEIRNESRTDISITTETHN